MVGFKKYILAISVFSIFPILYSHYNYVQALSLRPGSTSSADPVMHSGGNENFGPSANCESSGFTVSEEDLENESYQAGESGKPNAGDFSSACTPNSQCLTKHGLTNGEETYEWQQWTDDEGEIHWDLMCSVCNRGFWGNCSCN